MAPDLNGKTALVTGAARGIGQVVATHLAGAGANIVGTDVRADVLEKTLGDIAGAHAVETLAIEADVGNERQVVDLVGRAIQRFGGIDILINNAGIRRVAPISETDATTWDDIFAANLRGQYLCTREVLRQGMLASNTGVIIFVSSGSGVQGEKGSAAYCASKFGVTGLAQSVAKDLKETQIRTSCIMPGMIWTPMAAESEYADADVDWLDAVEVANAVMFLVGLGPDTIVPELRIYHRSQI